MMGDEGRRSILSKMADVVICEIKKPSYLPRRTPEEFLRSCASRILGRSLRRPKYDYFWTTAILLDAAEEYSVTFSCGEALSAVSLFFDRSRYKVGFKDLVYVDEAMNLFVLCGVYQKTGLTWQKQALDRGADYLINIYPKTIGSTLPYRPLKHYAYVDTIGMVCPFLARYGLMFGNDMALALAAEQVKEFLKCGMCSETGLPYHGYNPDTGTVMGAPGWGRGIGWLLTGMAGMLRYLPRDHTDFLYLAEKFHGLVNVVLSYANDDGSFPQFISCEPSAVHDSASAMDSGATGMIGYAIASGIESGVLSSGYSVAAKSAFESILSVTDGEGRVYRCSGEAGGAGKYSKSIGWFPWGQGPAVALGSVLGRLNDDK